MSEQMVKTNITILMHEDKTSKGNPPKDYTRFKCQMTDNSTKWMSAFDKGLIDDLKNHENILISVEIAQVGDFFNLKKFNGKVAGSGQPKEEEDISFLDKIPKEKYLMKTPSEPGTIEKRTTTMYVSYAKDIFIGMGQSTDMNKDMAKAIELVKQAQSAFS